MTRTPHLTHAPNRIFIVAGLRAGQPWPLRLEPTDRKSAEDAIRWQVEGGSSRDDFALATYDADREEFSLLTTGEAVRLNTQAPYTAEAWARFQAAYPSNGKRD